MRDRRNACSSPSRRLRSSCPRHSEVQPASADRRQEHDRAPHPEPPAGTTARRRSASTPRRTGPWPRRRVLGGGPGLPEGAARPEPAHRRDRRARPGVTTDSSRSDVPFRPTHPFLPHEHRSPRPARRRSRLLAPLRRHLRAAPCRAVSLLPSPDPNALGRRGSRARHDVARVRNPGAYGGVAADPTRVALSRGVEPLARSRKEAASDPRAGAAFVRPAHRLA